MILFLLGFLLASFIAAWCVAIAYRLGFNAGSGFVTNPDARCITCP